jgi:hypothetical protein
MNGNNVDMLSGKLTAGAELGEGTGCEVAAFLGFFRDVSVPLASERLGDPMRFRPMALGFFNASTCLGRPDGVLVPFVDAPDSFSLSFAAAFSSSVFLSSSLTFSASLSSSEL